MYIIVGIDPGITKAMVAIDFHGNILFAISSKELDFFQMVKEISKIGTPSIISCDVSHAPAFVRKISASFSAKLFYPKKDYSEFKKKQLSKEFYSKTPSFNKEDEKKILDVHQRDAYFASIYALNHYLNKFRKIDSLNLTDKEKMMKKHFVIMGKRINKKQVQKKQEIKLYDKNEIKENQKLDINKKQDKNNSEDKNQNINKKQDKNNSEDKNQNINKKQDNNNNKKQIENNKFNLNQKPYENKKIKKKDILKMDIEKLYENYLQIKNDNFYLKNYIEKLLIKIKKNQVEKNKDISFKMRKKELEIIRLKTQISSLKIQLKRKKKK